MPVRLPDNIKSTVIQQWLAGNSRDKIAFDCGISTGAVWNIVNEWRMALGFDNADALRDLAVTLNKVGINPAQCAVGFRVATMLRTLGVHEDKFESFLSDVHNRCCNELGLTAKRISFYISGLAELSNNVPISQIPNYISQKADDLRRLERQIQELTDKIEELQAKKSELERSNISALHNHAITQEKLNWYSKIKEELENKYGIPVDNISKLAVIVDNVANLFGHDAQKVVDALSNLQSLKIEYERYQRLIEVAGHKYHNLSNECSRLQGDVDSCNQALALYGKLFEMGFGLKELKLLWHTIREISYANDIRLENAVSKFFKDIEDHYDDKLGFESKKQKLQEEIDNLSEKKLRSLEEVNAIPKLRTALIKLFSSDFSNNNIEEFSLLVDQVGMVGGLRTAIEKLTSKSVAADEDGSSSRSPVFLSNNNDVDDGATKTGSIEEMVKPLTEHNDNNSQEEQVRDIRVKYARRTIRLSSKKADGSISFRLFSGMLFYVSLYLILVLLTRKSVIARKEEEMLPIVENESCSRKNNQFEEIIKELQPYDIQEPDFKLFHGE